MILSEAVKPISHVKTHMSQIVEEMSRTHQSVVVTHNGEAKAVLQDIRSYEDLQESLAMLKIVAMSTNSMLQGKGTCVSKAFSSVRERAQNLLEMRILR